jgi:hypothetical protein
LQGPYKYVLLLNEGPLLIDSLLLLIKQQAL